MKSTHVNSIFSRTAMTLLLAVFATTTWATDISTITVGGVEYSLFSGFTVTAGHGGGIYSLLVDGDDNTTWASWDLQNSAGEYYEVQFQPSDDIVAVTPVGYILYSGATIYGVSWHLSARLGDTGLWTILSVRGGETISADASYNCACDHSPNAKNKGFNRFFFKMNSSITNLNHAAMRELRIYGWYYTHLTAKAATCTETGVLQECYYRSDGKYFADLTGETELSASDVIEPMLPHTCIHGVFPNNVEYWQCSVCGKYFTDAACTEEFVPLTSGTTSWTQGRYFVIEDVTIPDRITVSGEVSLTLYDNTTLTASKGINVGSGNTLQINGFSTDEQTMGRLIATSGNFGSFAAIGGSLDEAAGTIVITGGRVEARTSSGAGIGGGMARRSGDIYLHGGVIIASSFSGSGIGSGQNSKGSATVNISDGIRRIEATSVYGMAIGNGSQPGSGTVTVNFYHGSNIVTGTDKDAIFYDTGEGSSRVVRNRAYCHSINIGNDLQAHIAHTPLAITGETVTLTLDYAVDETTLTVSDGTGNLTLTNKGNRQYSFVMPDGDVTVTATLLPAHSITIGDNLLTHVTASAASAYRGETVTLTLDALVDETTLNVSDGTNNLTLTDKGSSRQYSFIMPDGDVSVTATILEPHSITIGDDLLAHVTASAASAYKGETITLTLDELVDETTLIVSDGTNNLTLTDKGNRQYSFVIPDGDVTVTASLFTADLRDGVAYGRTSDFVVATATYTKTLGLERVGKHQAWLVPFDYTITAADLDKFTFYKINMIANSPSPSVETSNEMWVFLTRLNAGDMLHANMPYVYKPKEAVTDYEFTTAPATLKAKNTGILSDTRTMEDIYSFYATYENTTPEASDPFYYVGIDGNVSLGNNGAVTVGPYRWIIRKTSKFGNTPSYVRQMHFYDGENDDVDGIVEVQGSRFKVQAGAPWYDLSGRKVSLSPDPSPVGEGRKLPRGIYIHNGKKVVIK